MTVKTTIGAPVLDSGDFQATTNGVTWGLKLQYVPTTDGGTSLDLLVVEPAGVKGLLVDCEGQLKTMGVSAFLTGVVIPAINAWFKARFGSSTSTTTPPSLPQYIVDLDKALKALTLTATGVK